MKRYSLRILTLFLAAFTQSVLALNIGIVTDGPAGQLGWSPELFKNELKVLTKGEFNIRFPKAKQLDGDWSVKQIKTALAQLQKDPEVDMVLALGYVSGPLAALGTPLRKPTFAPLVMDADLLGLPRMGNSSGVANLNYLSGKAEFTRDLASFRSVVNFKNVAVLIDKSSFDALPGLINRALQVAAKAAVKLQFVVHMKPDEDLAAKLPHNAEAVIVTSLPRLSADGMDRLIAALIEKDLPSFSLLGSHLVERGILMSESPTSDWPRIARRNALNMYAVLRGESAGKQPVTFKGKRRLTLNMATARAIGVSPRFDLLNEAILLFEEPKPKGRLLTLAAVAVEAVEVNLDLRAALLGLDVGHTNIDEAKAKLLPQFNAAINYSQLNNDSNVVRGGLAAEKSTTAAITLQQLIYSDQLRANVKIQRYLQDNRFALYRQLELDIIQEATLAYLNVLKEQTFLYTRQENLKLTRSNLELAQDRLRIGVATPAEVYRWESELATTRKQLLAAQARLQEARNGLNRLLHRPLKESFIAQTTTLDDPGLLVSRKELFDYVMNNRTFELMSDFMVEEGLQASPELANLDALIAAVEQQVKTKQRVYWLPSLTLRGDLFNVLKEDRYAGVSTEGDTDWQVAMQLSLPIFEGGARRARLASARLELQQRKTQQDASRERIEQRIRASLHRIEASHPSIQLSKDAASAAQKNLTLITDAYTRGVVSILDLLDAQNAAFVAEESATNAVFDFLIDLMNLERSTGQFEFFLGGQGLDDWLERLKHYIDTHG